MSYSVSKVLQFQRAALTAVAMGMMSGAALAASGGGDLSPVQGALDSIIEVFMGPVGTSVAILAVILAGVAALTGRLTWMMAGIIISGIVLIFGSKAIVEFFKGAVGG